MLKSDELNPWTRAKQQECYHDVRQDDDQRLFGMRSKLAVGLGAVGFEHKIKEIYAGKKISAKSLLKEAAVALGLGEEWPDVSPRKNELAVLQVSKNMQPPDIMVRRVVKAGLADDWSELMSVGSSILGRGRSCTSATMK